MDFAHNDDLDDPLLTFPWPNYTYIFNIAVSFVWPWHFTFDQHNDLDLFYFYFAGNTGRVNCKLSVLEAILHSGKFLLYFKPYSKGNVGFFSRPVIVRLTYLYSLGPSCSQTLPWPSKKKNNPLKIRTTIFLFPYPLSPFFSSPQHCHTVCLDYIKGVYKI